MTQEEIIARLLYRDGLILVVDKPAGLPVHRGPKGGESFEDFFRHLRFGLPRDPALGHRLDRDTSGCLVLGRHRKALEKLMKPSLPRMANSGCASRSCPPCCTTRLAMIGKPLPTAFGDGFAQGIAESQARAPGHDFGIVIGVLAIPCPDHHVITSGHRALLHNLAAVEVSGVAGITRVAAGLRHRGADLHADQ